MVLWGRRTATRRLCAGAWQSAFRVKTPRYHVTGEEGAPYETLWELVNAACPGCLIVGCLVVAGNVGGHVAGPSGILSAVIAATSVLLSGICYAEFRARWPRVTGFPYEYTYLSTGEGAAFMVATLTFLQDVTMAAAAGRASSQSLDYMTGNLLLNGTRDTLGCPPLLAACPDPLGGAMVVVVGVVTACGFRRNRKWVSLVANSAVLLTLVFTLVVGLFHLDFELWRHPSDFFPASYPGVVEGAAVMIYAFSSYEIICGGSDLSRPSSGRAAVAAFSLSGVVSLALFMGVTATTTLLVPISHLTTETPLPEAFALAGVVWIKFIICIPSLLTLLIYMWMTLTRVHDLLEAVSLDALLCSKFSDINERSQTALVSVLLPTVMAAILAVLFSLTNLLQLASLACISMSLVICMSAVCIRFRPSILVHSPEHTTHKDRQERRRLRRRKQGLVEDSEVMRNGGYGSVTMNNNTDDCPMLVIDSEDEETFVGSETTHRVAESDSDTDIDDAVEEYKEQLRIAALTSCTFLSPGSEAASERTARRAAWTVVLFTVCLFTLFLVLTRGVTQVRAGNVALIVLLVVLLCVLLVLLVVLLQQPQDTLSHRDLRLSFPLSPWIPLLAIILNVHLSLHLPGLVWILAAVMFAIGGMVYFIYGIRNSRASHFYQFLPEEETVLLPDTPCHMVEPQLLPAMSRGQSSRSCDRSYTSSEPDIPLMD